MLDGAKNALTTTAKMIRDELFKHKILYPASWLGVVSSVEAAPLQESILGMDILTWQHFAIVGGALSSLMLCVKTALEVRKLMKEKANKDEN